LAQRGSLLRLLIGRLPLPVPPRKWQLALADLTRAEATEPPSARLYDDLGAVQVCLGKIGEAREAYTRGLKLAPDDAPLRLKRAWAYVDLEKPDLAREDFAAVARREARTPQERVLRAEAHTGLGYVSACRNAATDAQREVTRALDALQGANHYLIQHNLACIYATLARLDPGRREPDESLAVHFLQRELDEAKRIGGWDDAVNLIRGENAFRAEFRNRPDFPKLVKDP
jgi:tetratricopeptide (TPR) repeat protein